MSLRPAMVCWSIIIRAHTIYHVGPTFVSVAHVGQSDWVEEKVGFLRGIWLVSLVFLLLRSLGIFHLDVIFFSRLPVLCHTCLIHTCFNDETQSAVDLLDLALLFMVAVDVWMFRMFGASTKDAELVARRSQRRFGVEMQDIPLPPC